MTQALRVFRCTVAPSLPAPPVASRFDRELASAREVLTALLRSAKGVRIYLPNNPVLINFLSELAERLRQHLASYRQYQLAVEPFSLSYLGVPLYENRDPKESLAFRLHCDGIRRLSFGKGIGQQELARFLGVVAFEPQAEQDEDLVTRLWERNLPHISYLLQDNLGDLEWAEEETLSQQDRLSRLHADLAQAPAGATRLIPVEILALTRQEASWLRQQRLAEEQRDFLAETIEILAAVVAGSTGQGSFGDFVNLSATLCRDLLSAARIGHALQLLRFLDQMLRAPALCPAERGLIRDAITGTLSAQTVPVLQQIIDSGETLSHDELRELLQIFGLPCLAEIGELLGRVEKLKMRKVIVEALIALGGGRPEVFTPFLADPRWYLVRNVVLVLGQLETPGTLELVVPLIAHKEQRIRKEVLTFLERSSDAKAKHYLLRYLRDPAAALRIRALQILARERPGLALKPVLALAAAPDFKGKELAEKKAVCQAIGELAGEQALPLFRRMLLDRRWFKGVDQEAALCAVAGLMKIRTPAALELLEQARKRRNPELRALLDHAIGALGRRWSTGVSASAEV